ncbi:phospholipid phosphatase-related protein type 4 isoform X2 [Salminus brasiliensis]|uniref:phospholipid phosphatase-related protein type 4 isoform X2 n=1 Tax=Salminus brasiliensis TaxID=930266 RepID=UPI003B82E669
MSARERLKARMTKDSVTLLPCFYFVELPILVSSVVSLYFLEWTDLFKPVRWGFACHDRSLSLPYIEPTHEVIPFLMLLSLAFAAPAITIMIGEGILFCCLSRTRSGPGAEADINAAGCNFNSYVRRAVRFVENPSLPSMPLWHPLPPSTSHAIICGLTRIIQHKNHAIDVYLGFLLGGGIAVYLGLYAVGNFQPSEEKHSTEPQILVPVRSLADLGQRAGHHLPAKSCSSSDGLSSSHSEGMLHRNPQARQTNSLTNLKRSSADVEVISPRSPVGKESMVTFSNTLPRMYSPAMDDVRRAATIHSSMDSSRSKQLLSQWKSKNENRKLSLQAMENGPGQSPSSSMETRSSSEPSAVGINGEHQGPAAPCYKLATGSTTLPSNPSGIAGGARISLQSRPGSSQLVHIPEETQEGIGTSPGGNVRDKWLKSMEKSGVAPVRTNVNGQPRIMQVIAMSKQQGLLPTGSPSSESSHTSSTAPLHRYKSLTEETGSGAASQGATASIVRVEAHPENGRPLVHAHSTDGSGSLTWKSQSSFRQSFELNDLNRDSESSESFRDGYSSTDRKRSNSSAPIPVTVPTVPTVSTVCTLPNSVADQHPHQAISTIRVTPMESIESGPDSRDSTLSRKSKSNMILIPERGNSPDNTRNIFYKGTSTTPAFKE